MEMVDTFSGGMYNDPSRCQWCGGYHSTVCPRVKAIEYYDGGLWIKRVEFWSPGEVVGQARETYPLAGNK
jgi:hypothetical protein